MSRRRGAVRHGSRSISRRGLPHSLTGFRSDILPFAPRLGGCRAGADQLSRVRRAGAGADRHDLSGAGVIECDCAGEWGGTLIEPVAPSNP